MLFGSLQRRRVAVSNYCVVLDVAERHRVDARRSVGDRSTNTTVGKAKRRIYETTASAREETLMSTEQHSS
jgi:hypothetical protein